MVDFSSILDKGFGQAKKPKVLPAADYPAVITGWQPIEAPKDKEYKVIVRFSVKLLDWPAGTDPADQLEEDGTQIDLGKRKLRRDYYDNRLFDLDQLFIDAGVDIEEGTSYRESLPMLVGAQVLAEVTQYVNQRSGELGNQINNLRGLG